ncbi:hypothetical protein BROUX41_001197 [Berkeleyomyces rouxiae]|uniref:uncharacterized protein n=1 Tax=Berkeleyomyces rouxiae TaxID=2035830 RepID=UPI003B81435F
MGAGHDSHNEKTEHEGGISPKIKLEDAEDKVPAATAGPDVESHLVKARRIQEACDARDIPVLQRLALSGGGFLRDDLRRSAWDDDLDDTKEQPDSSWTALEPHHDEGQVQLDVNRSFVYYPNDKTDDELSVFKQGLSDLMVDVLRHHPYLHYFQGYHDVCQVFLLVFPHHHTRARAVSRLSLLRIRDFMLTSLRPTVAQLHLIPDILAAADAPLRRHLAAVVDPFYALAGTLTMYAHNIERYGDIARLFDAILATEPAFTVYVFAHIILSRRDVLLDIPNDEEDVLHAVLSQVPQPLDVEALIAGTMDLMRKYPPQSLSAWRGISKYSCLKTYASSAESSSEAMQNAARNFQKQTRELEWQDTQERMAKTLWKYRKPAQAVCAAVTVGLVAIYLRKNPTPLNFVSSLIAKIPFSR